MSRMESAPHQPTPVPTSGAVRGTSLGETFDPRRNSLNALRLALATAVVVSHAGPLTGRPEPRMGGVTFGVWAVYGFFIVSGFLITRSRLNRPLIDYYRDRVLRIVPGYVVALLVTALFFAPLGSTFNEGTTYRLSDAFSYVLHNLLLYPPGLFQETIGNTLDGVPYIPIWNGPLYTLFYEALAYVAIATLVSLLPRRALGPVLAVGACLLTVAALAIAGGRTVPGPAFLTTAVPLALAFAVGALLWLYRARVPAGHVAGGAAAAVLVALVIADRASGVLFVPYGLLLLYLGMKLPLIEVGRRRDISYGMYVYAWPVQMLLVVAAPALTVDAPMIVDVALVVAVTAIFAVASYDLVEGPALRRKKSSPRE